MVKKHLLNACIFISCLFYFHPCPCLIPVSNENQSLEEFVEEALKIDLPLTHATNSIGTHQIQLAAFNAVKQGNYKKAFETITEGICVFPTDFGLQAQFAILIGDYAGHFSDPLKTRMINRSKQIFIKLRQELAGHSKIRVYRFKNEYFYRFAKYKDQYNNGLHMISEFSDTPTWDTEGIWGYYFQGVGAANYAKILLKQDKTQALDYAQKALVAWSQFFSYDNTYYNAFVHYALALGILGYKDEMHKALQQAAHLIGDDLTFPEFEEVIDFIDG